MTFLADKWGAPVTVGDRIRVLKLPDVTLDEQEWQDVSTMLNKTFTVEQIEYGCVTVSQWFGSGAERHCHSLFLWPGEFERVCAGI